MPHLIVSSSRAGSPSASGCHRHPALSTRNPWIITSAPAVHVSVGGVGGWESVIGVAAGGGPSLADKRHAAGGAPLTRRRLHHQRPPVQVEGADG